MSTSSANIRRPRAEDCKKLTLREIRSKVQPGQSEVLIADGTACSLRWKLHAAGTFGESSSRIALKRRTQPRYGNSPMTKLDRGKSAGWVLELICPSCGATCRNLWKPPEDMPWGCRRCLRISYRSNRRSGSRKGRPKPSSSIIERLDADKNRCVHLLGWRDLPAIRRLSADPQSGRQQPNHSKPKKGLSPARREALKHRLVAIEVARQALMMQTTVTGFAEVFRLLSEKASGEPTPAERTFISISRRQSKDEVAEALNNLRKSLASTSWAVRRPAGGLAVRVNHKNTGVPS